MPSNVRCVVAAAAAAEGAQDTTTRQTMPPGPTAKRRCYRVCLATEHTHTKTNIHRGRLSKRQ